jgi:hypothetical protein
MSATDYLINVVLIGLVLLQIRPNKMTMFSLIRPLVIVAAAAIYYLKGIPTAGHDVALDLVLVAAGGILGGACALATRVWRGDDGAAYSKAGVVAAILWILGVGSRLAFSYSSDHGFGPHIARFSIAHDITSTEAWVAALVLMALSEVIVRLVILRYKGFRAVAGRSGATMAQA